MFTLDNWVAMLWLVLSGIHAFAAASKIKLAVYTSEADYIEAMEQEEDPDDGIREFLGVYSKIKKAVPAFMAEGLIILSTFAPAIVAADGIRISPAYVDFSRLSIFLLTVFCLIYLLTSAFHCLFKMKMLAAYSKSKDNVEVAVRFININGNKIFPMSLFLVDIVVKIGIFLGALQLAMHMFL